MVAANKKISLKKLSTSGHGRVYRSTGGRVSKPLRASNISGAGRRGGRRRRRVKRRKTTRRRRTKRRKGGKKRRRRRMKRRGTQSDDDDTFVASRLSSMGKKKKIKHILPLVKTLQDIKPRKNRSILLSHLDDEACQALYETIFNVLYSDKLHPSVRQKLKRILKHYKKPIEYLGNKRHKASLKRKRLVAMGGFPLTAILSAAVPLLIDLLLPKK